MALMDPLLVLVAVLNFFMVGTGRMNLVVYAVAIQGAVLGLWPILMHSSEGLHLRTLVLVTATLIIKMFSIPRIILLAMQQNHIRREIEPIVGLLPSLLCEAVGTGLSLAFASTLPLSAAHQGNLMVPISFATLFTGFLILITRRRAIMQVLGYVVIENGVFLFGMLLLDAMPFLVEVGVLLDLFVAIFVMGILIHHISREFTSTEPEDLSALRESLGVFPRSVPKE